MLLRLLCGLFLLLCGVPQVEADINVFIYHRFNEPDYPATNITAETFAAQLAYLKQEGYQVLSLTDIARRVREGGEIPDKTVGLSVDDAFTSFARHALPLMRQYGFPVTLFVNTDAVGTSGYLSWDELRAVMAQGVEIGNHTASHAYLIEMEDGETSTQWQQRISADIERSQRELKKQLNVEPEIFAYTYGEYSPAVVDLIRQRGFKAAFSQQSGVVWRSSNIWALPRFPMGGPYATLDGFVSKLKMRALALVEVDPFDPVIRNENPPVLRLTLKSGTAGQVNCFAQGGNICQVKRNPNKREELVIVAQKPLAGRRNKYTLTQQGDDGQWRWYSHLWINGSRPIGSVVVQP